MLREFPLGKPLTIEWVGTALPISEPYHCHGNPHLHGPAAVVRLLLYVSHASDDSDPFYLAARRQKSRWIEKQVRQLDEVVQKSVQFEEASDD